MGVRAARRGVVAVAWPAVQYAFAAYVTHVDFTHIYGALSAPLVLLLWFYCIGSIFLFGAEYSIAWPTGHSELVARRGRCRCLKGSRCAASGSGLLLRPSSLLSPRHPDTDTDTDTDSDALRRRRRPPASSRCRRGRLSVRRSNRRRSAARHGDRADSVAGDDGRRRHQRACPSRKASKRADFLTNARTNRADFYISGYVTPVGDHASVVEQVVSIDSGVILFSQTAQVQTRRRRRVAVVACAPANLGVRRTRNRKTSQTQPANTPAPTSTNGAQVPIQGLGSIVNSVFKHKGARTPTPAPVVKPSRGVIVAPLTTSGYVAPADLTSAVHELYYSLNTRFQRPDDGRHHIERRKICRRDLRRRIATTRSRPARSRKRRRTTANSRPRSISSYTPASAPSSIAPPAKAAPSKAPSMRRSLRMPATPRQ